MSNPMQMWSNWLTLSTQAARLGFEAQSVVALRMMRLAAGGAGGQAEAQRMVTEKVAALVEAQAAVATTAIESGTSHRRQKSASHRAGKKVIGVYKKRVRANRRRLSR